MFSVLLSTLILASKGAKGPFDPVIEIVSQNLQPETALYTDEYGWLVSSKGQGPIYSLVESDSGSYYEPQLFFDDVRLFSSVGFRVKDNYLYVCNSNPVAQAQWAQGLLIPDPVNLTTASLFIHNLNDDTTEEYFLDDAPIVNNSNNYMHFCNDIAVDDSGDVYITDSFQGVVYKLANGTDDFTILSQNEENWPLVQNFACNGITLSDDGSFLMITITHSSTIWKISLQDFANYQVNMDVQNIIPGFDGQLFSPDGKLMYTIHNQAHVLYEWETDNNWDNVTLKNTYSARYGGCTSVAVIKGRKFPYVSNAYLGEVNRTRYYLEEARFSSSGSCSSSKNKSKVVGLSVGLSILGVIAILAILWIVKKRKDDDSYDRMG